MKLRSMKLKELIKIIESNGWVSRRNAGVLILCYRNLEHQIMWWLVTIIKKSVLKWLLV